MNATKIEGITIFSTRIARDLIHQNFKLADIKPNEKMRLKTVFYFEDTEEIKAYLKKGHNIHIK